VINSQGYPVNATNGLVRSEHNTVILKNLDPEVTEQELQAALGKTACPVTMDIRRSPESKKRVISAIVTFRSHKEAKRVAEHFRKREIYIRKKAIKAEIGKDSSPRSPVQPTVVNGSTADGCYL
jgi:RNA recognition motif-containing protein